MIRFEKLGVHDYAVYVDGESDAIGKAGILCGECWFLARQSLGGGITWEKSMVEAVKAWAEQRLLIKRLKKRILQEMVVARIEMLAFPEAFEKYDDEEDNEEDDED